MNYFGGTEFKEFIYYQSYSSSSESTATIGEDASSKPAQSHPSFNTQAHTPSFFPLIPTCIIVRIASYIFDTIIIPILLPLIKSSLND